MVELRESIRNNYAEHLMQTIKEEEVAMKEYADYNEAYQR